MQHNKDFKDQDVKIYYATNQFPELQFLGTHSKTHGVRGLGKHYHIRFDPKLVHGTCEICHIPCACIFFTSIMDQTWVPGFPAQKKPHI